MAQDPDGNRLEWVNRLAATLDVRLQPLTEQTVYQHYHASDLAMAFVKSSTYQQNLCLLGCCIPATPASALGRSALNTTVLGHASVTFRPLAIRDHTPLGNGNIREPIQQSGVAVQDTGKTLP